MFYHLRRTINYLFDGFKNYYFKIAHRIVVPLRYQVETKGIEFILNNPINNKGTLYLSNHTSHIDATIISMELLKLHKIISIWALDETFKLPYLRWAARHPKKVQVVKVPNINERRSHKHITNLHKLITRTGDGLNHGKNFLIFPAGRCKLAPREIMDGKSAVPQIIRQCPDVNIVLVRITGMWGSRFSFATKRESRWSTNSIRLYDLIWQSIKMLFLNGFFFIPKRKILVEFVPAGPDFPRFGTRLEINSYLEKWYNQGWGPHGEALQRVPDYFWKAKYIESSYLTKHYQFNISSVAKPIRNEVVKIVADQADRDCKDVDFNMYLGRDLGLDSLDILEILTKIEHQFKVHKMVPGELSTVGHLIAIAAKVPITLELKEGEFHHVEQKQPIFSRIWAYFA